MMIHFPGRLCYSIVPVHNPDCLATAQPHVVHSLRCFFLFLANLISQMASFVVLTCISLIIRKWAYFHIFIRSYSVNEFSLPTFLHIPIRGLSVFLFNSCEHLTACEPDVAKHDFDLNFHSRMCSTVLNRWFWCLEPWFSIYLPINI